MSLQYDDILKLPHHVSSTHPQMPMSDRAAQFSPFAALNGYDDAIRETGRLTDDKIELDDEGLRELNTKLCMLAQHLEDEPEVTITYFAPDERKTGGAYLVKAGGVKRLDDFKRLIIMNDGTCIPMDDVFGIEGDDLLSAE